MALRNGFSRPQGVSPQGMGAVKQAMQMVQQLRHSVHDSLVADCCNSWSN